VRKALIIASEVRSGSTFVAESIAYHFEKTFGGVLFDLTKEPFAGLSEASSHEQILTTFNSLYLGHQGWVATKIMCAALSVIMRETHKSDALRLAFFGPDAHWIVIRRREKVRQAVSLAYARKSGDWHVYGGAKKVSEPKRATLKETEDALRSILLSDIYLESFKNVIRDDKIIEVFYEDFLSDPKVLIEQIYDVLGVIRPKGGVRYVDQTKIRRQATKAKRLVDREFKAWLLQNYHAVAEPKAPNSMFKSEPAQVVSVPEAKSDMRVLIVEEFLSRKRSIRFLAEKYKVDRSLISYWISKHKHGELEERTLRDEELTFFKAKVASLQHEIDQMTRQFASAGAADGHD
jgi:LPS sulfotransferase NodH